MSITSISLREVTSAASPMAALNYLTVQDILWINLQITKKVQHFNYARLEEATFYQYAYGESSSLLPQADRFVSGFVKMHPFDAGNEATALVACLGFLQINGYSVSVTANQLGEWFDRAIGKTASASEIATQSESGHHAIVPDVRGAIGDILERYSDVVESLYDVSAKVSA
jgi:prophage maintenance system killer protein